MRSLLVAVLVVASATAVAAQKPDFSGSWKLNPAQSDSLPTGGGPGGSAPGREGGAGGGRGMGGRMGPAAELFINQLTSRMTIDQKVGEQNRTLSYSLDGTESRNPGMMGREFVTTTTWVESTLVTKGKNSFTTPMGEVTIETTEVRSLSDDGKTMTVALTMVTPRGTTNRKVVYDKQ
ncbi:MAG: hypothetical protein ACKVZ0_23420 [Gemmatimonadales bacterium]